MKLKTKEIELMLANCRLTKTKFADLCGISRQSISTILQRGTCEPRTAAKLASGLGVQVEEIVDERG